MEELKNIKHSVSVVLINEEGLVLHVSRKDDHTDWALVGGKVDPEDESFESAAIRETKEETGLDISDLFEVYSSHKDGYMGHTYIAKYSGEINFDPMKEPHLVEWKPFVHAMNGSFGKWNTEVLGSLMSLGVEVKIKLD